MGEGPAWGKLQLMIEGAPSVTLWYAAYAYLFVFAAVASAILSRLAVGLGGRTGALDMPAGRKDHTESVPHLGGAAIYAAMLLAILAHVIIARALISAGSAPGLPPEFIDALRGVRVTSTRLAALVVGGGLVALLGFVDDMRPMPAAAKFAGQIAVAGLVVGLGVRATLFVAHPVFGAILSLLWIVGVTNAFNFLDHMDGLAAGVALVSGALFLLCAVLHGQLFVSAVLAVFCGCLAGFLTQNRHPARLFMGDCGSHFVGFTMACLTILATFYTYDRPTPLAAAMPLLILGVPLFDAGVVVVRRLRAGRSFWVGDRTHLSHRLVDLGMSVPGAVRTVYLLTFAVGAPALLLGSLNWWGAALVLLQAAAIFLLLLRLEAAGSRRGASG